MPLSVPILFSFFPMTTHSRRSRPTVACMKNSRPRLTSIASRAKVLSFSNRSAPIRSVVPHAPASSPGNIRTKTVTSAMTSIPLMAIKSPCPSSYNPLATKPPSSANGTSSASRKASTTGAFSPAKATTTNPNSSPKTARASTMATAPISSPINRSIG